MLSPLEIVAAKAIDRIARLSTPTTTALTSGGCRPSRITPNVFKVNVS